MLSVQSELHKQTLVRKNPRYRAQKARGGLSKSPSIGPRNVLDCLIKQASIHATRKQREISELPQIGGFEESITNDSIGTPGSCSFLQRQVEQGHSSRWVILLSASTSASAGGLGVAVGTNTEGSKRISSALLEFLQSNCRLEDPHLAEASEQKPKTRATTRK
jgi:hypothetical protein